MKHACFFFAPLTKLFLPLFADELLLQMAGVGQSDRKLCSL